jgi:hypothetical protein
MDRFAGSIVNMITSSSTWQTGNNAIVITFRRRRPGNVTAIDGSTWAVGWAEDTASDVHAPLILHNVQGVWSLVPNPSFPNLDSGLASVTAVPGGGLWAVGVTSAGANSNYSTLIEYHP